MQITIHDEATRRVYWKALWAHAASDVDGESLGNYLFEQSWALIHPDYGSPSKDIEPGVEVSRILDLLIETRAASERLLSAKLGESVDIPLSEAALVYQVDECKSWLEQNPEFWSLSRAEQVVILDCREAARWLLKEDLGSTVVA